MEDDFLQQPVRSTTPQPTGTVEIDEVEDLNDKLAGLDELRHITADELGLAEAAAQGVDGPTALPAAANSPGCAAKARRDSPTCTVTSIWPAWS